MGTRRTFTDEFKQEAVRMVLDQGLSVSEAARRLGIHSTLRTKWKKRYQGSSKPGPNAPTALEEENRRLRAENERLRMEREILKKRRPSSRRSPSEIPLHRRSQERMADRCSMRPAGSVTQWLLCLATSASERASMSPRGNDRSHPRDPSRVAPDLRLAARSSRTVGRRQRLQ